MEKKRRFRNYPNPVSHMAFWGAASGTILAAILVALLDNQWLIATDFLKVLGLLLNIVFIGLFSGGLPGAIIGLLAGWILSQVLKEALVPFTWEEAQSYRTKSSVMVGMVSFLLAIIFTFLIGWLSGDSPYAISYEIILLPLIIALVSVSAVYHYFYRLRLWSLAVSQKEKNKNFEHLEDTIEETDFDDNQEKKLQRLS